MKKIFFLVLVCDLAICSIAIAETIYIDLPATTTVAQSIANLNLNSVVSTVCLLFIALAKALQVIFPNIGGRKS